MEWCNRQLLGILSYPEISLASHITNHTDTFPQILHATDCSDIRAAVAAGWPRVPGRRAGDMCDVACQCADHISHPLGECASDGGQGREAAGADGGAQSLQGLEAAGTRAIRAWKVPDRKGRGAPALGNLQVRLIYMLTRIYC